MGIILLAIGSCFVIGLLNLLPQAFGAGKFRLLGVYTNRMIIVSSIIFFLMQIPVFFSEAIFLKMGQSANVSFLASQYIRISSIGVIFFNWSHCYGSFSSSQNKPGYQTTSTISASIIHIFLAKYLAVDQNMKMLGISIATAIHFFLRYFILRTLVHADKDL